MIPFFYTVSDQLVGTLQNIDRLRNHILTTPLSPQKEIQYRWETMVKRIHGITILLDLPFTQNNIAELLRSTQRTHTADEALLLRFRDTIWWLAFDWIGSPQAISPATMRDLLEHCCGRVLPTVERQFVRAVSSLTAYLAPGNDHALVQASVAFHQIALMSFLGTSTYPVAIAASYLYLYKSGFDLLGMASFKKELFADKDTYDRIFQEARRSGNLTHWNEFFAESFTSEVEKTWNRIRTKSDPLFFPSSWQLNERQKAIIGALEDPQAMINNTKVQRLFHVSQVTASRDLTHLVALGVLYPHGKGRSTVYTRS